MVREDIRRRRVVAACGLEWRLGGAALEWLGRGTAVVWVEGGRRLGSGVVGGCGRFGAWRRRSGVVWGDGASAPGGGRSAAVGWLGRMGRWGATAAVVVEGTKDLGVDLGAAALSDFLVAGGAI